MKQLKKADKHLPKISIIVTSYNKEKYISLTLQSILNQQYPSLEIVVVDDGSTDNSLQIINSFAKKHPKIFKVFAQKNKGQIKSTNLGIAKSTGEIVNFLNSDDYFDQDIMLQVGSIFKDDPELLWLTGYSDIINRQNKKIFRWVTGYKNFLLRLNKYQLLLIVNYITFSGVFIKKSALQNLGGFSIGKVFLEYELWLKLGQLQNPMVIKRNLVHFRLAAGNLTSFKYRDVLTEDYAVTKRYTSNKLLLLLHKINNFGRILLINFSNL